jgi:hypothetical protein
MKTRQITINTDDLNLNYDDESLTIELVKDYIVEDLDVPSEYIKSLNLHEHCIDINLNYTKNYLNDDWYVNIMRIA